MTYFRHPIEPNLCSYTLPNFSNIVYQLILPQRGTTLFTYFPPPIEPNLCTYTLLNFSNVVYKFSLPQRGTTLCTYFPPPIEPNLCTYTLSKLETLCTLPCPTLVILCTNFPYHNEALHYVNISTLPLNQICVLIPCPTFVILCTNLTYPKEVLLYYIFPPSH